MQKYGFIYIWYDKKHKKFYLGRHWGREDDGYICSSSNMRNNYKNRPSDFKRRIIKKVYSSNDDLILEEQRWLNMIKPSECCTKYYNKTLKSSTPSTRGYKHSEETRAKISKANKGRVISEEVREKLRLANKKQFEDHSQRETRRQKSLELWKDAEYRQKNTENKKGVKQSEETIRKRTETKLLTGKKGGLSKGCIPWNKGKKLPHLHGLRWFNNGVINVKRKDCPEGFVLGRVKKEKLYYE